MANSGVVSRFGTLERAQAEKLVGFINGSGVGVELYSRPREIEWCESARKAQQEANHSDGGIIRPIPDLRTLRDKLETARAEGEVPFALTGTPREISGFLNRANIAEVELIPPDLNRH